MKPEDVPQEWVDIAFDEFGSTIDPNTSWHTAFANALAAVAPLIVAAERELCAEAARAVAMQWREQVNSASTNNQRTTFADREAGAMTALAAIRARGTNE
jgi:hypothetical protein